MEAKSFTTYSCLLFLCSLFLVSDLQTCSAKESTTALIHKNYIRKACNSTLYPKDCNSALSYYAPAVQSSSENLCKTALNVTLGMARDTAKVIASLARLKGLSRNETALIKDCAENVDDSIDRLKDSLRAMAKLDRPDRRFQLDNVRTWSSAALSDETTCSDELDEMVTGKVVRKKMRDSVLKLYRMTSNFLALMNYLGNY